MMRVLGLAALLAASAVTPAAAADVIMPHLEIPKFPPQWNLTMSTMTQLCFGPTPLGGGVPLNNETGRFLRKWGVIEIDFESEESLWAHHHGGKDADVLIREQQIGGSGGSLEPPG